jgi:hypothetical protein
MKDVFIMMKMTNHTAWLSSAALVVGMCAVNIASADVDISLFDAAEALKAPEIVSCTLENGEDAQCVQLVVPYKPANLDIGPFCPTSLSDEGGIWDWDGENAGLYRLNATFFEMLQGLGFEFADADGAIYISDPGAGRPEQVNTCLEASEDDSVVITALIPVAPQMADTPTDLGTVAKVGMGLDGVPIFADAPSVLDTGHLPALDTCGGHVDPGGWYHWHATSTDIDTVYDHAHVDASCALEQSTSAQFGYAFDGYAMFGTADIDGTVPTDLDACNGHFGSDETYHYHATAEFPNLPPCLSGVVAKDNFSTTASNGIGAAGGGPDGGPSGGQGLPAGFESAADTLGVTATDLLMALQAAGAPQNLDMAKAATSLGVTVEALSAALPKRP